jgi:7-carboxy-7-deazaguanine synthase
MPVARILESVERESTGFTVVTGGEPMMMPSVVELTAGLRRLDQHITIETAGTLWAPVDCDLMSISPKTSNSTPEDERWRTVHEGRRWRPEVLSRLAGAYANQFKFVVQKESDLAEIKEIIEQIEIPPEDVVLMPEGVDSPTLAARGRWIAEICKREGYRYGPRLHVDLWGDRRGV